MKKVHRIEPPATIDGGDGFNIIPVKVDAVTHLKSVCNTSETVMLCWQRANSMQTF